MASTSLMSMLASAKAFDTTGTKLSACARLAISGITPPYRACSSIDDATTLLSNCLPRTTAAAVSSHVDSIPSITGPSPGFASVSTIGESICDWDCCVMVIPLKSSDPVDAVFMIVRFMIVRWRLSRWTRWNPHRRRA